MTGKDELIGWDEAVTIIMRTGRTKRQARLVLMEKLRQGKIAGLTVSPDTGEIVTIPKEVWPKVN
jgi:hypothetical protein